MKQNDPENWTSWDPLDPLQGLKFGLEGMFPEEVKRIVKMRKRIRRQARAMASYNNHVNPEFQPKAFPTGQTRKHGSHTGPH